VHHAPACGSCGGGPSSLQCRWVRRMRAAMGGEEGGAASEGKGNEEHPRV
jgi:hypothetical protein